MHGRSSTTIPAGGGSCSQTRPATSSGCTSRSRGRPIGRHWRRVSCRVPIGVVRGTHHEGRDRHMNARRAGIARQPGSAEVGQRHEVDSSAAVDRGVGRRQEVPGNRAARREWLAARAKPRTRSVPLPHATPSVLHQRHLGRVCDHRRDCRGRGPASPRGREHRPGRCPALRPGDLPDDGGGVAAARAQCRSDGPTGWSPSPGRSMRRRSTSCRAPWSRSTGTRSSCAGIWARPCSSSSGSRARGCSWEA